MEYYFQEMLVVVFFGMLFRRVRLRGTYSKFDQIVHNQREMSRKGMEDGVVSLRVSWYP